MTVFHFHEEIRLHAGKGGQEVIEDLLGCHAVFATACADFQPTFFIAEIALSEIFGAHEDEIAVIGEFHEAFRI